MMPPDVSRESFARVTGIADVSRESWEKLLHYHAMLEKWQRAVNLVSPATLPEAWQRHFVDSAQIGPILDLPQILATGQTRWQDKDRPEMASPVSYAGQQETPPSEAQKITLFDFGSGGGFPGLVLAMLYPEALSVHLVESDQKKCSFMAAVSRETNTPVSIHNVRIENLQTSAVPDIITARALADLGLLLDYAAPWAARNPDLVLVLPKGERFAQEIEKNRQKDEAPRFAHCAEFPSITDKNARILRVSGLNCPVRKE